MKRFKKVGLLVVGFLLVLTSCNTKTAPITEGSNGDTQKDTSISLNVTQANLIADVTENAKYLNKDLLLQKNTLEDSDSIGVIITLENDGIIDDYQANRRGYSSLKDYKNNYAVSAVNSMKSSQEVMADYLIEKGLIESVKHSYTTLFNGFSAKTTYGNYKKLVKLGLCSEVTVSEVYSLPETVEVSRDSDNAVENEVDVYETGIFDSSNVGYTGMNTTVAILDSGFDVHHTVFKHMPESVILTRDDVKEVIDNTSASSFTKGLKAEDVYINKKIPYAYDYADKDPDVATFDSDHGTHVAGIIGGKDDVITGVAIDTQLVLMKVFGDVNNGALAEDILAALEDAVVLGVDAINLSLGTSCGFSNSRDDEYVNEVYKKIEDAGISMVVAASNDYNSQYGSANSNTAGASNPDYGSVGSPGTYTTALSVASVSGVKSHYIKDSNGYVFFFNEANSSGSESYDFYEMLFEDADYEDGKDFELEYVTIPGYGDKANYIGLDVKGKVALVKRGDLSFEEKAEVAISQGAIACIVYNNIGGDILMSAGNDLEIPFCSISKDDGEYLASKGTGKLIFNSSNLAGPFMSEFSSWGPSPDLSLKPEITAHGGSILSAVHGGGYDEISGTSMACPNMTGVIILLRQYIHEKFPTLDSVQVLQMANQLSMSTATIILDEVGNPYSPRKQGSGLANLREALKTQAFITVDGCDKAKIELYDDPKQTGIYELNFNINNLSNQNLSYKLSNLTMTESLSTSDPEYISEMAYMLDPNTTVSVSGDGSITGDDITVNANGTVKVKYTLTIKDKDTEYIRKSFENGTFIEGYAVLSSKNADGIDLSIPFLAFYGDWTEAPMFDKTFYEVEAEKYDPSIADEDKVQADYYATTPYGTYYYSYIIPLGAYLYDIDESKYDPIAASEEHAAIGYNLQTINGITTVYAGLLRNAKKMTTTITNSVTGEVVYENIKYDQIKAHYSGGVIPAYDMIEITAAELGLENNVKYDFKMVGELDYGDGGLSTNLNNTFEFSFHVDYEVPLITDANFYAKYDKSLKENRYYVDVYVYDNHYAQSIRPFTIINGEISFFAEYATPIYGEKGSNTKVTIEITDYMDLLQYGYADFDGKDYSIANGLGFMVDDYALNAGYYYVTLPGSNVESADDLIFTKEDGTPTNSYLINAGEELDLTQLMTSNDPTFDKDALGSQEFLSKLTWKSNNEKIAKVKGGKVVGVSAGRTNITVSTMNSAGMMITKTISIVVVDNEDVSYSESDQTISLMSTAQTYANDVSLKEIKFTYFDTIKAFIDGPDTSEIGETGERIFLSSTPYISFYPSEKVKLGYEITPWNLDSSRYELIWSSTNSSVATVNEKGEVEAIAEGSATITLRIKVDGKLSNLMARVTVNVKNEFIIENRVLVAYKGRGGDVVIPDDEGILYVGPFAFSLYTTDFEIEVTEEDLDAGKTAGGNETITSVVIPYDVLEIQKNAFLNCPNLTTVTFQEHPKGEETCQIIREGAFKKCKSLKNIDLSNIMIIGASAFEDCTSLETVDFSSIYALGKKSFANCTGLKYVDITTLRNLGTEVFVNCKNLTSFDSGEFTNFSTGMFKNTGLTEINYYYDRIPEECFSNCDSLTKVTIHNDLIYVGVNAFSKCDKLTSVEFKGGSEYIYSNAFSENPVLTTVVLPNSDVIIEGSTFLNCPKLNSVTFNELTNITNNLGTMFKGVEELSSFIVNPSNTYYKSIGSLLLNKAGDSIVLAAPNYSYGEYEIPSNISIIKEGAFSGIKNLTSLNIHSNVLIEKYAFSDCSNLTKVSFPTENINVLDYAFFGCKLLNTIENFDKLTEINNYVFANTSLVSLVFGNDVNIGNGAFAGITTLENITFGNNNVIGAKSFSNNTNLANVTLGLNNKIGAYAFSECKALISINLENAIDTIGEGAFSNAVNLTDLNLSNIEYVSDYAFSGCIKVENVNLPKVISIGAYAFTTLNESSSNANQITQIILPDSLVSIGDYAFSKNNKLTDVTIGEGLESLGKYAFGDCTKLVNVTINSDLEDIKEGAFVQAESLKVFNASNIKNVYDYAFYNAKKLETIDLTKLIYAGVESFAYCEGLVSLNMPALIKADKGAFRYAISLVEVTAPNLEYIDEQAFSVTDIITFELSENLRHVAATAFYANYYLTKFTHDNSDNIVINDYATLSDGVLYTKTANNKYLLNSYPAGKEDKEYIVMDGTVRIEYCGIAYAKAMEKIIFPDTLKSIGNMAMYSCENLKTVEFRSTVAPVLEGTIMDIGVDYTELEIYEILAKYFPFNGIYPFYYAQFKDLVGTTSKMDIVLPSNKGVSGYDALLYTLYFKVDEATKSDYVSKDEYTIDYLDKVIKVPAADKVSFNDAKVISDARNAYNLLKQDLTDFGYSKDYLDGLYNNLVAAENKYNSIMKERINSKYEYLLNSIDNLGSKYEYEKIGLYYEILDLLKLVDRDDLKYIDQSNVEDFREEYFEYFDNIDDEIETLDSITELPTTTVNKVGRVVVSAMMSINNAIACAFTLLGKKWFI